jgi:hypothetical protein
MRQQSVRKETFDEVPHSPLVYTLAVFKASNDTCVLLHLIIESKKSRCLKGGFLLYLWVWAWLTDSYARSFALIPASNDLRSCPDFI